MQSEPTPDMLALAERRQIVAFLRAAVLVSRQKIVRESFGWAADAIERGEHKPEPTQ